MSYDDYPSAGDDSYGGSYPSSFGEDIESLSIDDSRPRIVLMGTRRSGKSSIAKVVFQKMSPHETLFLETTIDIRVREISTSALVHFQLIDFPGNFDFLNEGGTGVSGKSMPSSSASNNQMNNKVSPDLIFKRGGALVFVIDAQDDENQFSEAIEYFIQIAKLAYKANPRIHFDVLIHKVDGDAYLSDDHKSECQNEIKKSITEELSDANLPIRPSFHLTSIYDHTIFEAFSKIVQSLISQLPLLEKLLDGLIASCSMEKAFLFDVVSKIYVATDSNPVDMQTYELCSDMIDVVIDVSCIYGIKGKSSDSLAYDQETASVIKLSNNYVLYLREVNRYLALVCLMRADAYAKSGLIEYNLSCFRKAIAQLLDVKAKTANNNNNNNSSTAASSSAAAIKK